MIIAQSILSFQIFNIMSISDILIAVQYYLLIIYEHSRSSIDDPLLITRYSEILYRSMGGNFRGLLNRLIPVRK